MDLLTIVTAGALGALVATLLLGASLLLVIPAALGVGAVGLVAERTRHRPR
jgi:hypothetical protein